MNPIKMVWKTLYILYRTSLVISSIEASPLNGTTPINTNIIHFINRTANIAIKIKIVVLSK